VQCWGGEGHDDGDPPRLWVANGMYPGTAFTRSIGDSVAEQIGVSAVPEVLVVELRRKHSFFVIASDGVFEFLSSQAVVDMVRKIVFNKYTPTPGFFFFCPHRLFCQNALILFFFTSSSVLISPKFHPNLSFSTNCEY
jgi:hypothetical protein